jgi:uracil-DNA glycosylase
MLKLSDNLVNRSSIAPSNQNIFKALAETPPEKLKVLLLGQDPYPTPGHATGLAFAVNDGIPIPKSLINIFKEIKDSTNKIPTTSSDLLLWANQGILLLNSHLTTDLNQPLSHRDLGWSYFTNKIISIINHYKKDAIYILWGRESQSKKQMINSGYILTAAHPSPLSANRGFFGCNHFNQVNQILTDLGKPQIIW